MSNSIPSDIRTPSDSALASCACSDVRPKSVKFRWAGMDATCDICGKQADKIWWRSGEVLGAACREHVKDVMQLGIVGKMFEQLTKLQKPK